MRLFNQHSSREPDQGWSDSRVSVWCGGLPAEYRGWGLMGLLLGLAFLAEGCTKKSEAPAPPPPNVSVAHPVEREVTDRGAKQGRGHGGHIARTSSGAHSSSHTPGGQLFPRGVS